MPTNCCWSKIQSTELMLNVRACVMVSRIPCTCLLNCSTYGQDTISSSATDACLLFPDPCVSPMLKQRVFTQQSAAKEGEVSPAGSEPGPELWQVLPQALAHCPARAAPVPPAQQCAGVPKPGPLPTALNMPVTCCCPLCMQCIRRTECWCCMPYQLCCCLHMACCKGPALLAKCK